MGKINSAKPGDIPGINPDGPVILYPQNRNDSRKLTEFMGHLPALQIVDRLSEQLEELYFIRHPSARKNEVTPDDFKLFTRKISGKFGIQKFGVWVYYPWNGYLVHFLPEELHFELRTARNRNLITENEQLKYYRSVAGIAGLSIGNSIAGTLLHTGGPKQMRLADFDTLSASNTNRIRTSFINIGMKKTVIAAREIYEVNPYAQLTLYPDGLKKDLLEKFLCASGKIDILIEEMDNIYLKIQIRLLARKLGIPVIMATDNGDNILLDVERYDLDSRYPLFHGDVPESELLEITPETPKPVAARIITRWVHPENVVLRMQQSLLQLGKTLYSWPQLGTAAFLSGIAVSHAFRNIICGNNIPSGKYIISLDKSIIRPAGDNEYLNTYNLHTQKFIKMLHL
jgi:molybdopterin/thiamine biosynthesis adenylyltransferase